LFFHSVYIYFFLSLKSKQFYFETKLILQFFFSVLDLLLILLDCVFIKNSFKIKYMNDGKQKHFYFFIIKLMLLINFIVLIGFSVSKSKKSFTSFLFVINMKLGMIKRL